MGRQETAQTRTRPQAEAALATARAPAALLDWRAWYGAVRAEHATIALLRLQASSATGAVIKEKTGVGWHLLSGLVAAAGALDGRGKLHLVSIPYFSN
jgi:hypothetical protein